MTQKQELPTCPRCKYQGLYIILSANLIKCNECGFVGKTDR